MSVLDKAKAHYQNKLSEEPREIKIPEWDTTAYIKPAMSLQRLGEVMEAANSGKSAETMVLTIIYRLIDEDGKPIFRKVEKSELMRQTDPDVLAEIVNQINLGDPTAEDIEGN